jgi:hypothetical protein
LFSTKAEINGLSPTNNVGFVRFDWVITGVSSLFLDTGDGEFGTGVTVSDASSLATIVALTEPESFSDSSLHSPVRGVNGSTEDLNVVNLQAESFLVPYDFQQLAEGEIPTLDVAFEFSASTSLDITNDNDLGSFEALFDADFSNTATLASVTVLDSNELEIPDTSVVDAVTGSSLVASTVPEPSPLMLVALVGCAGSIRRRRRVTCGR